MGDDDYTVWLDTRFLAPGDLYIATEPLTPEDVELVEPVEDVGEDGYCTSCNKERHRVRSETCLDCRVHYGTASPIDQIVARELADYHRAEVVPLLAVRPVEVTAEDVAWADFYADQEDSKGNADWHELLDDRPCSRHHAAMARRIAERLAARQATREMGT